MICPICGIEMEKGALLIYDARLLSDPVWYPEEERKKKGLGSLRRDGGKEIGSPIEYRALSQENHYEAFYCNKCQKVIAHFNVKNDED